MLACWYCWNGERFQFFFMCVLGNSIFDSLILKEMLWYTFLGLWTSSFNCKYFLSSSSTFSQMKSKQSPGCANLKVWLLILLPALRRLWCLERLHHSWLHMIWLHYIYNDYTISQSPPVYLSFYHSLIYRSLPWSLAGHAALYSLLLPWYETLSRSNDGEEPCPSFGSRLSVFWKIFVKHFCVKTISIHMSYNLYRVSTQNCRTRKLEPGFIRE